jgi:iron complex transport system permease protein
MTHAMRLGTTSSRGRWLLPATAMLAAVLVLLQLRPDTLGRVLLGTLPAWESAVFWEFRLPRLMMCVMIGSGMAVSGWAAQTATRNPLASPDILTVPAAAGLGVMLLLWISGGTLLSSIALPITAAVSGGVSAALLFGLVGRRGGLDGSGLLLVGIAMGSLLSAGTFFIALNAHPSTYSYAIAWLAGSLGRASWDYLWLLFPGWWLLTLALSLLWARVDVLALEDPLVVQRGGRPDRWRRLVLCLGAALAAVCVGVGGNFGFLGFVAPHLVRGLAGRQRNTLWAVAVTGAVLLLAADTLGQYVLRPAEAPAGIVVAMLGAPCFVVALVRQRVIAQG